MEGFGIAPALLLAGMAVLAPRTGLPVQAHAAVNLRRWVIRRSLQAPLGPPVGAVQQPEGPNPRDRPGLSSGPAPDSCGLLLVGGPCFETYVRDAFCALFPPLLEGGREGGTERGRERRSKLLRGGILNESRKSWNQKARDGALQVLGSL